MTVIGYFGSYPSALARAKELALESFGIQNFGDRHNQNWILARLP